MTLLALLIFKIRYVCCFENCLFVSNLPWLLICRCSKMMQENSAPEATNRGNFGMTEILQFLKIARDYYSIVQFTTMYIMSSTIFKVFFFLSKFLIMIVVSSWNIFQERSCYDLICFWRWYLSLIEFLIQFKDAWKIEMADKCWYQRFQPLLNGLNPNPNKDNFYHGDSIYVTKPSWIRINQECFVL